MKIIYYLLIYCITFACEAQRVCAAYNNTLQTMLNRSSDNFLNDTLSNGVITIPVVVHVLYNDNFQKISNSQVLSQIESLNKDYNKLNDISNIPAAFSSLAADVKIKFCLAKTDPQGIQTSGIIFKSSRITSWSANDEMKFSASGGDDAWDSRRYLNIWVCNLSGSLGYSSLPGSPADKDGIVIQYNVFGTTGNVKAPFNEGRTLTHETGHWLGLKHLWGDVLCGDDMIDDTPPQKSYNNGCPSFPHISACSKDANGDMFMNFMDFTDDACMSMFTNGQKTKIRSLFAPGNARNSFLSSSACNEPVAEKSVSYPDTVVAITKDISLYPNPAKDFIYVEIGNNTELIGKMIIIYNLPGQQVKKQLLTSSKTIILINDISSGVYVVKIGMGKNTKTLRLVKQ
jgi:hypothetical protein